MANGDPVEFPRLTDPAVLMARKPAAAQAQPQQAEAPAARSQTAGRLGELMDRLNSIEDPFTRSIVQGTMEARISNRIGQTFHFPDPEEEKLQRQKTQREYMEEIVKTDAVAVQIAKARMMDLDEKDRAVLGIEPGEDIFATRPEAVPEVTKALFDAGRMEFPVSMGMMSNAKLPTSNLEAQTMDEMRRAKTSQSLGQAATDIQHGEALAKTFAQAQEGEGLLGESFKAATEATEQQTGIDPIAESDEDKGSSIFYSMTNNLVSDLSAKLNQPREFIASAALAGEMGANLKDELEGIGENEAGELSIGTDDDLGVSGVAKFYLTASALNLGAAAGLSDSETMKALKLPYSGVDMGAFLDAGDEVAKKRGISRETLFASLGPGIQSSVERYVAKLEAVKKATPSR